MQRLSTTTQSPAHPPVESLEEIHNAVIARIKPILSDVWPAAAPLRDFDLDFSSSAIVINVQYDSIRDLDKITQDLIVRDLQEKLGMPDILLIAKRVHQPRKTSGPEHRLPR